VSTNIKAENNYTQASINGVLYYVPSVLQRNNNSQIPSITYKSGNLQVPFAIGVPKPKYRTISDEPIILQQANNVNWGELGLGLLVLAAIRYSSGK
jgi:hypothetical protein